MALRTFLAMTAAEIQRKAVLPEAVGWMACHFSPYGNGLSNLPGSLPSDSLLILNDRIPIHRHDPETVRQQLEDCIERNHCQGLLLDFQQENCTETANLVRYLSEKIRCPVAVSAAYCETVEAAVLLSPLPHPIPLTEYIKPWLGRELWLELAPDAERISVTKSGASVFPMPAFDIPDKGYPEDSLHCHYRAETKSDSVEFTLWRTEEDLRNLLREAETLGISHAVGLYQELGEFL